MIEFFSQHVWLIWILIAIICLIIELGSGDLFVLCFAIGAGGASIASALGGGVVVQIITFAVVTLLSLYVVRPVALRWLHRNDEDRPSNTDALAGRRARVSEDIKAGDYGRVALDGDDWKACSADGKAITKGTFVRVVRQESVVLVVEEDYSDTAE